MDYIEITFSLHEFPPYIKELLPSWLEPLGFESFAETETGIAGYIPSARYDRNAVTGVLKSRQLPGDCFLENLIAEKNWNEEWERNFEPVVIDGRCLVRAPFHPRASYPYVITIEPKMSFGTGHHETTSLMIREMLDLALNGCTVLDAGCGTGILAILAEMLGASFITAMDTDEWCYTNAVENVMRNNCSRIDVKQGDATMADLPRVDCILANINLNVLLQALPHYASLLKPEGTMLMSGILHTDTENLIAEAVKCGFETVNKRQLGIWMMIRFQKNNTFNA